MSIQACANIVHRADTARWRAAMAAPLASREVLLPIYAANVEISRAPWVTQEPLIAHMRLQWWRDALDEIEKGKQRSHEVIDALAPLMTSVSTAHLQRGIDARAWDIEKTPFASPAELKGYVADTAFAPMMTGYLCLGGESDHQAAVYGLAFGLGMSRFLQAVCDLQGAGAKIWADEPSPTDIRDLAQDGANMFQTGKHLLRQRLPETAALIEAAGADRFLRYISKHPETVHDGTIPAFALRSAVSRASAALGVRGVSAS